MDPEAAPDEKGLYWDSTPQWRNLGLDFFSQPSNIPAAASHSGGYGAFPRREANGMEGLDLNSEAANITGNMSYLDLLRSSPAGWAVEGGRGGDARGAVRSASRGAGRGAGRGGVRAAGRGASGSRVSGRAAAAGNRAATDHDIGVPSPTAGRGRGRGHTTPSRRPSTSVPQQFHPPRPAGGGLNTVGATDAANADFDSGLQDQELASYPWSQNPYDEEADDIQELDASMNPSSGEDDESVETYCSSDDDAITRKALSQLDFVQQFGAVACMFAGWPGSAHDMRVFNDAINKYGDKFPHPPQGKFYLVDSGFPNRPGYLAPYKGTKYHLPEFRQGPRPRGKKEQWGTSWV
ncbi:unnamed protein product [Urochloa humidicola]